MSLCYFLKLVSLSYFLSVLPTSDHKFLPMSCELVKSYFLLHVSEEGQKVTFNLIQLIDKLLPMRFKTGTSYVMSHVIL